MATPADYPPIASSLASADGGGQVSYHRITTALPHCLVSPSGSSGHITPNVFGSKENLQNNEENLTKGIDDSIEQAEGEGRELTVKSSIFNLVSTVIGGGVLSLPYTCNRAGIIVAPIILLVIASLSAYSGMLLLSCSKRVRKRRRGEAITVAAESYEDVPAKPPQFCAIPHNTPHPLPVVHTWRSKLASLFRLCTSSVHCAMHCALSA